MAEYQLIISGVHYGAHIHKEAIMARAQGRRIGRVAYEFWTGFNDAMSNNDEFKHHFRARKASPQHWYDLSAILMPLSL